MKRNLVLTLLLVVAPALVASSNGASQGAANVLPDPADYVAAGPHCKKRVNMSPSVGTPSVNWPHTYRCVLTIHTCQGLRTTTSGVRPGGTGMCDDFWRVHDQLANREICCDAGARKEKPRDD